MSKGAEAMKSLIEIWEERYLENISMNVSIQDILLLKMCIRGATSAMSNNYDDAVEELGKQKADDTLEHLTAMDSKLDDVLEANE